MRERKVGDLVIQESWITDAGENAGLDGPVKVMNAGGFVLLTGRHPNGQRDKRWAYRHAHGKLAMAGV